VLTGQQS